MPTQGEHEHALFVIEWFSIFNVFLYCILSIIFHWLQLNKAGRVYEQLAVLVYVLCNSVFCLERRYNEAVKQTNDSTMPANTKKSVEHKYILKQQNADWRRALFVSRWGAVIWLLTRRVSCYWFNVCGLLLWIHFCWFFPRKCLDTLQLLAFFTAFFLWFSYRCSRGLIFLYDISCDVGSWSPCSGFLLLCLSASS